MPTRRKEGRLFCLFAIAFTHLGLFFWDLKMVSEKWKEYRFWIKKPCHCQINLEAKFLIKCYVATCFSRSRVGGQYHEGIRASNNCLSLNKGTLQLMISIIQNTKTKMKALLIRETHPWKLYLNIKDHEFATMFSLTAVENDTSEVHLLSNKMVKVKWLQ